MASNWSVLCSGVRQWLNSLSVPSAILYSSLRWAGRPASHIASLFQALEMAPVWKNLRLAAASEEF